MPPSVLDFHGAGDRPSVLVDLPLNMLRNRLPVPIFPAHSVYRVVTVPKAPGLPGRRVDLQDRFLPLAAGIGESAREQLNAAHPSGRLWKSTFHKNLPFLSVISRPCRVLLSCRTVNAGCEGAMLVRSRTPMPCDSPSMPASRVFMLQF